MLRFELKGGEKVEAKRLNKAVIRAAHRAGMKGAETYFEAMHDYIDAGKAFTPRTGNLQQSLGLRPEGKAGALIYAQSEVADFLEHGTDGPYAIRPRKRRALAIPTEGGYFFCRAAVHPGIRKGKFNFFFADYDQRQGLVLEAVQGDFAAGLNEVLK